MLLRIQSGGKLYELNVEGATFQDCLTALFASPYYYFDGTQAIGIDLLRLSVITLAPVAPEPETEI